jgi:O-antigen/teichoic acid export membrane protein
MRLQNTALRVSKNTSVLFLGTVSRMLFSFAFTVYIARFLGVEGFGKVALTERYFELFLSLSATGLTILIIREIAKKPALLNRYLTSSVILVTGLTVIAGGIMVVIANVFGYASDTRAAMYIAAIALLPATIGLILEAIFVAFEQAEYVTYGTIFESLLRTGLGVLVLQLGYGLLALFVVLVVVRVCQLTLYLIFLRRQNLKLRWDYDWPFFKRMLRDWRVFALEAWVSNINNSSGVILLSILLGEAAVGLYVAAGKLLRLGRVVAQSYTTAIFPHLSRVFEVSKEMFQRLSEGSLKYMLALVFPFIIAVYVLADRLIIWFYTDEYARSVPILRVLVWILLLSFFNPFLSRILSARGEQRKSLQVALVKLICLTATSFWMIQFWGEIGLAWSSLLSTSVAFCLYFVFVLKGEGIVRVLLSLARPAVAAVSLGAFLLILRNAQPIPVLIFGGILYVILLFMLRVLSSSDLKQLQKLK